MDFELSEDEIAEGTRVSGAYLLTAPKTRFSKDAMA